MKMTQDEAQEIIRNTYGSFAYAIGHTEDGEEVTIFYLYNGEDETEVKAHQTRKSA